MPVHKGNILQRLKAQKEAIRTLPTAVGQVAHNFFIKGFELHGWQGDHGLEAWQARKRGDSSRAILVKTGALRRSMIKIVAGNYIAVKVSGQAAQYADVHNFGFKGSVSVAAHINKHPKGNIGGKIKSSGIKPIGSHTRQMNMPMRKFIGNSKALDRLIAKEIEATIKRSIKFI